MLLFVALAAALVAPGCAPSPSDVSFRVAVVGDDPFLGADAIELRVVREGGAPLFEDRLAPSERSVALGPLPFGAEMSIVVETRLGTLPLGGGRSFPFVVPGPGAAPTRSPDVTLGLLGRHAVVATLGVGVRVLAIAPTSTGALLVTDEALVPFLAHGADGRPALAAGVALPAARLGACFVALPDGVLAVGGAAPGATLFSADGAVLAETTSPDLRAVGGAALAALDDGSVLVAGGRDAGGARLTDVRRLELGVSGLVVEHLAPLLEGRSDARAVALSAPTTSRGEVRRVLLVDGTTASGPADDLVVLDPDVATRAPVSWLPPIVVHGAALASIETGQVLMAGGRDAGGLLSNDVRLLFVDGEDPMPGEDPLAFVSPAPDPGLLRARQGATALAFASGVALILGGTDATGLPVEATELANLRVLPGSVRGTGSLPVPAASTAAALLADRSILVAAEGTLTLYFPYPLE